MQKSINIVVDVNMSESRKAEIFTSLAQGRATVEEVLSVPYTSIFQDFCPQWRYTQEEVLHEVINMVFDKGTDAVWNSLYKKAFKCRRSMRSKGSKMSFACILSEIVHDYLKGTEEINHFYRLKRVVEKKITQYYYASGEVERGDIFKHSIID